MILHTRGLRVFVPEGVHNRCRRVEKRIGDLTGLIVPFFRCEWSLFLGGAAAAESVRVLRGGLGLGNGVFFCRVMAPEVHFCWTNRNELRGP